MKLLQDSEENLTMNSIVDGLNNTYNIASAIKKIAEEINNKARSTPPYISMDLFVEQIRQCVGREVCANKRTICSHRTVFKHVGYLFDGSVRRRLPSDLF